jgi:short-subunit dehydrogenase
MNAIFKGKVFITGVSEGIGKALVKKFIQENYQVVGVARNEAKLAAMRAEFKNHFSFVKADLCNPEDLQTVLELIESESFDICINNAGLGGEGKFTEIPYEKHQEVLDLNISALVKISYSYLRGAKRGDALVNVSSVLAFAPMPNLGLYSGTKAFVTSLTETLYIQYKDKGIFVCSLHPGKTLTDFKNRAGGDSRRGPNVISGLLNQTIMGLVKFLPRSWVLRIMNQVK